MPTLSAGAGVVTSRGDVHHVVTEHGHVNLFGMGVHSGRARPHLDRPSEVPRGPRAPRPRAPPHLGRSRRLTQQRQKRAEDRLMSPGASAPARQPSGVPLPKTPNVTVPPSRERSPRGRTRPRGGRRTLANVGSGRDSPLDVCGRSNRRNAVSTSSDIVRPCCAASRRSWCTKESSMVNVVLIRSAIRHGHRPTVRLRVPLGSAERSAGGRRARWAVHREADRGAWARGCSRRRPPGASAGRPRPGPR